MRVKGDAIRSILLIQLGDIGDLVLVLPAIDTLRGNFPKADLVVAVREKAFALIEDHPAVNRVISVDRQKKGAKGLRYQLNLLRELWTQPFDLAVELRTGTRGAFLAMASMAKIRVGRYERPGQLRNLCFTHLVKPEGESDQYAVQHNLNILAPLNLPTGAVTPFLPLEDKKRTDMKQRLKRLLPKPGKPFLVIHPFSIWQYKELTFDQYRAIILHLATVYDVNLVVTGGPDEETRAEQLIAYSKTQVLNMAGKTSISEMAYLLGLAVMVISIDTSAIHIAAAVGTPTLSIFGPSSAVNWAPRGPIHKVITHTMPCIPCRRKGCEDKEVALCLRELAAESVCDALDAHIEQLSALKQIKHR